MEKVKPTRSPELIRRLFRRNQREHPVCIEEAAQYAVNTSFMGFEDPRSSAEALFAYTSRSECGRSACNAVVKLDKLRDKYELSGKCADANVCAAEVYNAPLNEARRLREMRLVRQASSEQLGLLCPHVECEFSFGYTIDGNVGTSGNCMRAIEVASDTEPVGR